MDMKKVGPQPLKADTANRLLDLLIGDDAFRQLFQDDAKAALLEVGYQPTGRDGGVEPWHCLQLKAGAQLASKDRIAAQRPKLEAAFTSIFGFDAPREMLG